MLNDQLLCGEITGEQNLKQLLPVLDPLECDYFRHFSTLFLASFSGQFCLHITSVFIFCCCCSVNIHESLFLFQYFFFFILWFLASFFFVDASLKLRLWWMCVCASVKLWLLLKKNKNGKIRKPISRVFCVSLRIFLFFFF